MLLLLAADGLQDWNYVVRNCFGITLELFEQKYRPEADLSKLWEENKDALLQLPLVAALGGESLCPALAWQ
jgi:hypothetical protein